LREIFKDLAGIPLDILTIGQYLAPSEDHWPVERFLPPEEFESLAEEAKAMGIPQAASGPLVRSSYQAKKLYQTAMNMGE